MSLRTESIKHVLRMEGKVPFETEAFLQASDEGRPWHCSTCGGFMIYRQHSIFALVEDDLTHLLLPPPLTMQCIKCGHTYRARVF